MLSSDWSAAQPLIGRSSGHGLGQLGPLRPLEALLARPGPRCPHGLNVLQQLGQPVLGALVILTQDTVISKHNVLYDPISPNASVSNRSKLTKRYDYHPFGLPTLSSP